MRVFGHWKFEGKVFHVSDKGIRRKNRHDDRGEINAIGDQHGDDCGFQPRGKSRAYRYINDDSARRQQHGINRRQIIILAVEQE